MSCSFNIVFMIALFLIGMFFYLYRTPKLTEGLKTINGEMRCPNMLIQKGSKYYLYNTNLVQVPGVNPVEFNTLEDYTEFLEWQKGSGIRCPVLYLQHSYDAQGKRVYKIRPSVTELQGGLPPSTNPAVPPPVSFEKLTDAGRDDPPYNTNNYPAFDMSHQYVGSITPLDVLDRANENLLYSDNPMDPNWGGQDYTQALVDTGHYKDREVARGHIA